MPRPEKLDTDSLDHVCSIWKSIRCFELYATSPKPSISVPVEEQIFVYSLDKITPVHPNPIEVNSKYMRVYEMQVMGFTQAVGYVFIPKNIINGVHIRYTPFAVSFMEDESTKSAVDESGFTPIFSTEFFNILRLDCETEVIQCLSHIMGVSIVTHSS